MKILIDMNLSPLWAPFLRENGIEAVHWSSIGLPDATDAEIVTFAKAHDFTVLTNDLDFGYILAITRGKKPSVVQTRTGALGSDQIGSIVLSALKLLTAEIEKGALVTVDQHKTRVTLLPL
jgi:predicted nuclease of predicted toxin-antitoxin system